MQFLFVPSFLTWLRHITWDHAGWARRRFSKSGARLKEEVPLSDPGQYREAFKLLCPSKQLRLDQFSEQRTNKG